MLLASFDGDQRRRLLKGRLGAITEHTISRQKDLEEELSRVARRGYALNLEELELGYVAVAVGVRDGSGGVLAVTAARIPLRQCTIRCVRINQQVGQAEQSGTLHDKCWRIH